jgi:hypothetical protein
MSAAEEKGAKGRGEQGEAMGGAEEEVEGGRQGVRAVGEVEEVEEEVDQGAEGEEGGGGEVDDMGGGEVNDKHLQPSPSDYSRSCRAHVCTHPPHTHTQPPAFPLNSFLSCPTPSSKQAHTHNTHIDPYTHIRRIRVQGWV